MALSDITRTAVESGLEEFRRIGLEAMLRKYGGGSSTQWYVEVGNWACDQKLLLRAAHGHQGLGELPPRGLGRFRAAQATLHLESLGYRLVGKRESTVANLKSPKATEPLMRWLIGAAQHRTTTTYGEAASRLERECAFDPIGRRTRMGIVVGKMQYAIRGADNGAPLLLMVLVRTDTGTPGDGAREFLLARFPDEPLLHQTHVRTEHPELWSNLAHIAADEVYNYSGWEDLYSQLYGNYVPDAYYAAPGERSDTPRGGSGEGPNHEALRLWVMGNPDQVDRGFRGAVADTEEELLSGDRVDVVYTTGSEVLAIEVKSRDSNWADLRRGIYQCIKYGAVLGAQEEGRRTVRTMLVTESALPLDLDRLSKRLKVRHRSFPPENR